MKEKIYTIPVNEAYDKDCECPLCELEKQQEKEAVRYALGAAMMEPDYRMESNEKGYCNRHFARMFEAPNKLPLALVLDTHLTELRKKLEKMEKTAKALEKEKTGLFKKSGVDKAVSEIDEIFGKTECSCMVCEKINRSMAKFVDVLIYLWATESDFREKFDKSKGVCLKHFKMLVDCSKKSVKDDNAAKFIGALINKEINELNRIQEDIHRFTLKFDYRNRDMEWETAKDAPIRTIEKIAGYIINDYEEET
ncbi:MAG: DUF6062 family protein [Clostridiales bacterium]|nr:DUF6062 family protein [Clostridiales bacterium]